MARSRNGNGRLEDALATLIQNQASSVARISDFDARVADINARRGETDRVNSERFARIEVLLLENYRILQALPNTIRDKIGFRPAS